MANSATWGRFKVNCYLGSISSWDFNEETPWLCETDTGIDFAVPDWNLVNDQWDMVVVGISLDDLIDDFIDLDVCDESEDESRARRENAISAFERAIATLRNEPIRNKQIGRINNIFQLK